MYMSTHTVQATSVVEDDGWSPWTQVSPKGWWFLNIAKWERTRSYVVAFGTAQETTTCSNLAMDVGPPPRDHPTGGVGGWGGTTDPSADPGYYMWYQRPSSRGFQPTGVTERFWETQWEWRWFDPPDFLPNARALVGPTMFSGDLLRIETRWLQKMDGVRDARVLLNHSPLEHNERIQLASLKPGHQVLDIKVRKGRHWQEYQVVFAVRNKLDLVLNEPVADAVITSNSAEPNGAAIDFRVRNNTDDDIPAIVNITSVPEGWMARIDDYRPFTLKPHEERAMTLQVEIMNDIGAAESEYLPFALTCSSSVRDLFRNRIRPEQLSSATAYVRPRFDPELATQLLKAKEAFAGERPLVY